MAYQINSNAARNYHSSSNYDQTEQVQYETAQENQSSATGFTFDTSQRLNPALAPSEPSLQMQNFNAFPDVMVKKPLTFLVCSVAS